MLQGNHTLNSSPQQKTDSETAKQVYDEGLKRLPVMTHRVLAETTASISELKKNPMATVAAGEGLPVAVLNRNEPAFYCVPAKAYEQLMDLVEDLELNQIAEERLADAQHPVQVTLDEL
jgi:antitoxin StbD